MIKIRVANSAIAAKVEEVLNNNSFHNCNFANREWEIKIDSHYNICNGRFEIDSGFENDEIIGTQTYNEILNALGF